jgi:hypothetical protein
MAIYCASWPFIIAHRYTYGSAREARLGIGGWLAFYNDERPRQALANVEG